MAKIRHNCSFGIRWQWFFMLALALLVLPFEWVGAWLLATTFHELFHLMLIIICGGQIIAFTAGPAGMCIVSSPLPAGQQFLCALAGPVGSFLLALGMRLFPRVAICAGIQLAYNLLPIYPLDGGRLLRCILCFPLGERTSEKISNVVSLTAGIALLTGACYGCLVYRLGLLPVLIVMQLIGKLKTPCKPCKLRVQ